MIEEEFGSVQDFLDGALAVYSVDRHGLLDAAEITSIQ